MATAVEAPRRSSSRRSPATGFEPEGATPTGVRWAAAGRVGADMIGFDPSRRDGNPRSLSPVRRPGQPGRPGPAPDSRWPTWPPRSCAGRSRRDRERPVRAAPGPGRSDAPRPPRRSSGQLVRSTSAVLSIRVTVWVNRERLWCTASASSAIRSRRWGCSDSVTKISYSGRSRPKWRRIGVHPLVQPGAAQQVGPPDLLLLNAQPARRGSGRRGGVGRAIRGMGVRRARRRPRCTHGEKKFTAGR